VVDQVNWCPEDVVVAVTAKISAENMILGLTNCGGIVVATDAVARNVNVIKVCRDPAVAGMAVVASFATCDVILILADGDSAVMA
jgi:hypothetical protein